MRPLPVGRKTVGLNCIPWFPDRPPEHKKTSALNRVRTFFFASCGVIFFPGPASTRSSFQTPFEGVRRTPLRPRTCEPHGWGVIFLPQRRKEPGLRLLSGLQFQKYAPPSPIPQKNSTTTRLINPSKNPKNAPKKLIYSHPI